MKQKWKDESGQTMVLFTLMLTILIGVLALVIDYGMPTWTARRLQNAADSAALAAATMLPADSAERKAIARTEAIEYATKNGYSNADVTFPDTTTVKVIVNTTVEYSFAKIFGLTSVDLERSASAQVQAITSLRGVVPLSVEKSVLDAALSSKNYDLTLKVGGGAGNKGAYGAIDLDGSNGGGASQYENRLINGYDGLVTVGDLLPTENGNMSGPTEWGVQKRYNACTHYTSSGGCTPEHYDKTCPRVMMIPVVVYTAKHTVQIKGFAPFLLKSYSGSGNECYVYGTYLPSFITDGEVDPSIPANPYGPYTVKLVD